MKEKTQYQKDFEGPDRDKYKNPGRLVQDNLVPGGPKQNKPTHYQNEFPKKDNDPNG